MTPFIPVITLMLFLGLVFGVTLLDNHYNTYQPKLPKNDDKVDKDLDKYL